MEYMANDQGVQSLKRLSSSLVEQVNAIKQETEALQSELDSNRSGLGPHAGDIQAVIDKMNEEVKGATSPVNELAEKINDLAKEYQEFINTKRF